MLPNLDRIEKISEMSKRKQEEKKGRAPVVVWCCGGGEKGCLPRFVVIFNRFKLEKKFFYCKANMHASHILVRYGENVRKHQHKPRMIFLIASEHSHPPQLIPSSSFS